MGLFDFLKPNQPTYNTKEVSEIILAAGTGNSFAKDNFTDTYNKMVEVFYKNPNDQQIVNAIYFELMAARLIIFFLACRDLRYKPIGKPAVMLEQSFIDTTKNFFSEIQDAYKIKLNDLFQYRRISYSKAFETAEKDKKYMAVGIVFHEYLTNSLKNRPLLYEVPNAEKPWLDGITSMNDIHHATQEEFIYCSALAANMIELANAILNSKKCNLVD